MPHGRRGRRRDPDDGRPRRAGDRDRRRLRATRSRPRTARTSTPPSACCASRARPRSTSAGRSTRCATTPRRSTPRRSTATRSSAAGGWPRTPPSCSRPARARSRTATRAGLRRAATAAPSARCSPPGSAGLLEHVWVDETRPLLQGARLTAWELETAGIPHAVIADSAAASLMAAGEVDCRRHRRRPDRRERRHGEQDRHLRARRARPAPRHSVLHRRAELDRRPRDTATGAAIPIEERDPAEITTRFAGAQPGVRRHAGGADRGDRHRARRPHGAVCGESLAGRSSPHEGVILLAAGYATRLRPLTDTWPKPLPVGGRPIIDWILDKVDEVDDVDEVHVVTNARFAAPTFRRWAARARRHRARRRHDLERRSARCDRRHPVRDRARRHRRRPARHRGRQPLRLPASPTTSRSGAARATASAVAVHDVRSTSSSRPTTASSSSTPTTASSASSRSPTSRRRRSSTATYLFHRAHLPLLDRYLDEGNPPDQPGRFVAWLYEREPVYGYRFAGAWFDIGDHEQLLEADNRSARAGLDLPERDEYAPRIVAQNLTQS